MAIISSLWSCNTQRTYHYTSKEFIHLPLTGSAHSSEQSVCKSYYSNNDEYNNIGENKRPLYLLFSKISGVNKFQYLGSRQPEKDLRIYTFKVRIYSCRIS